MRGSHDGWHLRLRLDGASTPALEWWLDGVLVATMCSRLEVGTDVATIWWTGEEAAFRQAYFDLRRAGTTSIHPGGDIPASMRQLLDELQQLIREQEDDEKKAK